MLSSINHNIMASGVANNLNAHHRRLATSVERLSSGLRINSASDDAAGLAIRELMRADMAALGQGVRNVNDAISMIQTADGALGVIDEKLIRMKELAEQAATGTYNHTQRMIINNEFQAMGEEINRIARATDFNGIKLLDGSLHGSHDGSGLTSTGAMKIHFGTGNDSAEDYYYADIGDCTLAGLGLAESVFFPPEFVPGEFPGGKIVFADGSSVDVNNFNGDLHVAQDMSPYNGLLPWEFDKAPSNIQDILWARDWCWGSSTFTGTGFLHVIPKGSKNVMINITGTGGMPGYVQDENGNTTLFEDKTDADIQLFTKDGKHLAGTNLNTDLSWTTKDYWVNGLRDSNLNDIDSYSHWLGFTSADYDAANLNTGAANYDSGAVTNNSLAWSNYNGMSIGYSGDGNTSNDGKTQEGDGYEILVIDGEVTEDLIVFIPGGRSNLMFQMYWDGAPGRPEHWDDYRGIIATFDGQQKAVSIETQENAQKALARIDQAIVNKDKIRANLGAMQNRLENTGVNLNIQQENLAAAESRISDTDVATEMTTFVRNQVLTQSATAMLGQANSYPHMLSSLING